MFPSLSILDTLDKIGKDAFNNSSMKEAVSRIPDSLFDKSIPVPPPPAPIHAPIHKKEQKKLNIDPMFFKNQALIILINSLIIMYYPDDYCLFIHSYYSY